MHNDPQVREWAAAIGRELRRRRKAAGLTLEQLSLLSSAAVPTVSHIERGNRDVKLSTLVSLARAVNADLPDLFEKQAENPDRRAIPESTTFFGDGPNNQ